jgi:lipopolysaccharide biosynthesis glycosyltransferase
MTGSDDEYGGKAIHVALAADVNYAMPLSIAICSAAANCDKRRRLVFYVIENGMDDGLKARVESSLKRSDFPSARIQWLPIELDRIADLKIVNPHLSPLAYARLLIPFLLPSWVGKALYLDSDLVVMADLAELWDIEVGSKALLAARDLIAWVGAPRGISDYQELGIPPDAKYFNSGVLLMNLVKWRADRVSSRVFDYLRSHRATIRMEDQEGLNAVLFDDWGELPFRWNWQVPWRMHRLGKRAMPWNPNEQTKSIIHFTTSEKPWLPGCDVKEKEYFFEYLDRTDWAGWRVPLHSEMTGRLRRTIQDLRDSVGSLLRPRAVSASTVSHTR